MQYSTINPSVSF